jgi:hypothetical protein
LQIVAVEVLILLRMADSPLHFVPPLRKRVFFPCDLLDRVNYGATMSGTREPSQLFNLQVARFGEKSKIRNKKASQPETKGQTKRKNEYFRSIFTTVLNNLAQRSNK